MNRLRSIQTAVCVVFAAVALTVLSAAVHADITVPNTFTSGTTISSSQVNANFSTLANAMSSVKTTTGNFLTTVTGTTTNNATTITSISVTPPVSGNLVAIGFGTIVFNQTTPKYNFATFSLNTVPGVTRYPEYVTHSLGPDSDAAPGVALRMASSLNIMDVFSVSGGVTTTIYLNATRDTTGVNTIQAEYPRLTVIFVPNTLP